MSYALVPGRNLRYLTVLDYLKGTANNKCCEINTDKASSIMDITKKQLEASIQYLKDRQYIHILKRGNLVSPTRCAILSKAYNGIVDIDEVSKLTPIVGRRELVYKKIVSMIRDGNNEISARIVARELGYSSNIVSLDILYLINDGKLIRTFVGRGCPSKFKLPDDTVYNTILSEQLVTPTTDINDRKYLKIAVLKDIVDVLGDKVIEKIVYAAIRSEIEKKKAGYEKLLELLDTTTL